MKEARKNHIKSLYVLRFDDPGKEKRSSENYMTIAIKENEFYAYNEFSRNGIVIRKHVSKRFIPLDYKKAVILQRGDEIYFELENNRVTTIECGGKHYSFIRMARFSEIGK